MEQRTVGIGRLDPEIARDFRTLARWSVPAVTLAIPAPITLCWLWPAADGSAQRAGLRRYSRLKVRINEVYTALNMIDYGWITCRAAR